MNVDCRWISQNLEAYFCDRLSVEEGSLARTHLDNCAVCREEVRDLRAIDSLVRKHFHRQLGIAHSSKRRPAAVVYGGAAAAVAAAILLVALLQPDPVPAPDLIQIPPAQASVPSEPAAARPVVKSAEEPPAMRSKPTPATAAAPARPNAAPAPLSADAPDFLVTDPAGYSRSLGDYRGYVLVLGLWGSDHPEAIASLERLYQTFSSSPGIRILGVSSEHQVKPARTTFPVAYNQGSRLLNARVGDFVVVDTRGSIQLRGSLSRDFDSLVDALRK